ncbi:MAG: hypothetical protein AB1656_21740 [Candidatus Omnitrophota bacterium]
MNYSRLGIGWWMVAALLLSAGPAALAQDVELPLTWQGKGKAVLLTEDEISDFEIHATIKVDSDGWVEGEFEAEDGKAVIKRFYYETAVDGARNLVIVLLDQNEENPLLILLKSRILKDRLLYGEVYVKPFEKEGEIEKGLNLGENTAQEIYSDYVPPSLTKALKTCKPIGGFALNGSYVK